MFCAAQQSAGSPLAAPTPGLDRGSSEFEMGWGWGAGWTPCRAQVHRDGCPGTVPWLWGGHHVFFGGISPPTPQCWLILVLLWCYQSGQTTQASQSRAPLPPGSVVDSGCENIPFPP